MGERTKFLHACASSGTNDVLALFLCCSKDRLTKPRSLEYHFSFFLNYLNSKRLMGLLLDTATSLLCDYVLGLSHSVVSDSLQPPWTVAHKTPLSMEILW